MIFFRFGVLVLLITLVAGCLFRVEKQTKREDLEREISTEESSSDEILISSEEIIAPSSIDFFLSSSDSLLSSDTEPQMSSSSEEENPCNVVVSRKLPIVGTYTSNAASTIQFTLTETSVLEFYINASVETDVYLKDEECTNISIVLSGQKNVTRQYEIQSGTYYIYFEPSEENDVSISYSISRVDDVILSSDPISSEIILSSEEEESSSSEELPVSSEPEISSNEDLSSSSEEIVSSSEDEPISSEMVSSSEPVSSEESSSSIEEISSSSDEDVDPSESSSSEEDLESSSSEMDFSSSDELSSSSNFCTGQPAVVMTLDVSVDWDIAEQGLNQPYAIDITSSAYYRIFSDSEVEVSVELYNSNCDLLASNAFAGTPLNFELISYLTAGARFYMRILSEEDEGKFSFKVEKN